MLIYDNKNLFLNLTYKCNAFCKKCMTRYHQKKNLDMDINLLKYVISKLKFHNYSNLISMGCGEPLLYTHCSEAIQGLLEINDSVRLRILTNGMALSSDLPEFYFDKRVTWGVTVDGFTQNDLHNIQQGVNIELVKENIRKIVSKYGADSIYLNYTLYSTNYDSLVEFYKFAVSLSIKDVYVTRLRVFEGYETRLQGLNVVDNEHLYRIKKKVNQIAGCAGIKIKGIDKKDDAFEKYCFKRNGTMPIIDVDGSLSFCCGREDVIIGNICDSDIEVKWENMLNRLNNEASIWCNKCRNCALPNGSYCLPKTIKVKDCHF